MPLPSRGERRYSDQYIKPLTKSFKDKIRVKSAVRHIRRSKKQVSITLANGRKHIFDQVVIATHSDQALKMLDDPSPAEVEILGAIPYQENLTSLHTDISLMPKYKSAWASWNYRIPSQKMDRVALTYHMNRLQNISSSVQFCVTLNISSTIDPSKKICELINHHPIYDPKGLAARKRHAEINGANRTWFCGAYWGYGFHEDGVESAWQVAQSIQSRNSLRVVSGQPVDTATVDTAAVGTAA